MAILDTFRLLSEDENLASQDNLFLCFMFFVHIKSNYRFIGDNRIYKTKSKIVRTEVKLFYFFCKANTKNKIQVSIVR
jgi:hypothetical protein